MTDNSNYDIINEEAAAGVGMATEGGGEIFNDYENNKATGAFSHAEGESSEAKGRAAHTEGKDNSADGVGAHAEGWESIAAASGAHAEGYSTAEGDYAHSEGYLTKASGANSHAEGKQTTASGVAAHSEGQSTTASGTASHSEGSYCKALGEMSHAEGGGSNASGDGAHAEGGSTFAKGEDSHAEGTSTQALGRRSHAGGWYTIARCDDQTVIGVYNRNKVNTLFEVGNGSSNNNRSNAFEVYKDGSIAVGGVTVTPEQVEKLVNYKVTDSTVQHPYSIAMFPETLTVCVGNTEQLTALPRPLGSVYDKIVWSVDNKNIVSVDNSGKITAKAIGEAVVTATVICNDDDKTEYSAKCFVTVEDQVIIKNVDNELQVHFLNSGRVWHCINTDMLYDENFIMTPSIRDRFRLNYYGTLLYNDNIIKYTDDEIRLLYAVDPFGVAYYIYNFAKDKADGKIKEDEDTEKTSGDDSDKSILEKTIDEKDRFFEVLFNKKPLYFYEAPNGGWYDLDKEDINRDEMNYCSESEAYFGAHQTYDTTDIIIGIYDFVVDVLKLICPEALDFAVETITELFKIPLLLVLKEYEEAAKQVFELLDNKIELEEIVENTFDFIAVCKSFTELIDALKPQPKYFHSIIDYCLTRVNFDVYLQLGDGSLNKLEKITNAAWSDI